MFKHDYIRIGTAIPRTRPAAVSANLAEILTLAREAADAQCDLVVFPELALTGYTCADLFQQNTLLTAASDGLDTFLKETADLAAVMVVGVPVTVDGRLFNAAAVCQSGELLGVVPKTFIPVYREYYEQRWFTSGNAVFAESANITGRTVPFGVDIVFRGDQDGRFCFGVEICEDMWAPNPPSTELSLRGASVIVNPSASNDLVGKADYRRMLVQRQSGACLSAYAYCSAGTGESTTDTVFSGHCMIAECGHVLTENERFSRENQLTFADIDLGLIEHERLNNITFSTAVNFAVDKSRQDEDTPDAYREIAFKSGEVGDVPGKLASRWLERRPFVPADDAARHDRCSEIFAIQSTGLATRLDHTGLKNVVIGLSGGLDSTLALLVVVEAFDRLGLDRAGIHSITMPGFGTTDRTLGNVEQLCDELGLALDKVDIRPSCEQHFADIGHDGTTPDIAFENVQARERTQILMDRANMLSALVIGTGDLSEMALGWCTYNGDHMSMYAVNIGVPKTLVKHLVQYVAEDRFADTKASEILHDVLATPISPELLPAGADGEISQKTEDTIGPYELHDFFLYYLVRCGFTPAKVHYLAVLAFDGDYDSDTIKKWLTVFCKRFFSQQFKRSCVPDGPKVGTIALSPRGDWRMPSDAAVDEWLDSV